jgi:predicted O-methyltransferase YrrM
MATFLINRKIILLLSIVFTVESDVLNSSQNETTVEQKDLIIPVKEPMKYNLKGLPSPYNEVQLKEFNGFGWFPKNINKASLKKIINAIKPTIIVELGSYFGKSARFLAKNIDETGIVYAVDIWPNIDIYHQFLSNIIHRNLTDKITPLRMDSSIALDYFKEKNIKFDLIYIDANHHYKPTLKHLEDYYPLLKEGGIMCGDDYVWNKKIGVKQAVDKFASDNNLQLKVVKNIFWYYLNDKLIKSDL